MKRGHGEEKFEVCVYTQKMDKWTNVKLSMSFDVMEIASLASRDMVSMGYVEA